MSQYLRDEFLRNLSLSNNALVEINDELIKIRDAENIKISPDTKDFKTMSKGLVLTYIIRFDNKGFKLYDFNKVIEYFNAAKFVERVIFQLNSAEHFISYSNKGKGIEIRFDVRNPDNCYISVQDDDQQWADSTFLTLQEVVRKFANLNYLVRNAFSAFIIQILGVLAGFLISLWAADRISPRLNMQYSYGFAFVISFLLFSNAWSYLYAIILRIVNFYWPNLFFGKHNIIYKLSRAVFFSLLTTGCASLLWNAGIRLYNFIISYLK